MAYSYIYHKPSSSLNPLEKFSPRKDSASGDESSDPRKYAGAMIAKPKSRTSAVPRLRAEVESGRAASEKMKAEMQAVSSSSKSGLHSTQAGLAMTGNDTPSLRSQSAKVPNSNPIPKPKKENSGVPMTGNRLSGQSGMFAAKLTSFAPKTIDISGQSNPDGPESPVVLSETESSTVVDPNRIPKKPAEPVKPNPMRPLRDSKIVRQCEKCKMLFNLTHVCG